MDRTCIQGGGLLQCTEHLRKHHYMDPCIDNLCKLNCLDTLCLSDISIRMDYSLVHINTWHDDQVLRTVSLLDKLVLLMSNKDSHICNHGRPHLMDIGHLLYILRALGHMLAHLFHLGRIHYDIHIQAYDLLLHIFDLAYNFDNRDKDFGIDYC